jgi:hypothetical protein
LKKLGSRVRPLAITSLQLKLLFHSAEPYCMVAALSSADR